MNRLALTFEEADRAADKALNSYLMVPESGTKNVFVAGVSTLIRLPNVGAKLKLQRILEQEVRAGYLFCSSSFDRTACRRFCYPCG